MDKAVAAGATGFGGLQYVASRQRELEREALKKAALDARARAEVLAKELGAILGKVLSVSELMGGSASAPRGVMMADAAAAGAPVMTGEPTRLGSRYSAQDSRDPQNLRGTAHA